jgi:hypothetical protein
MSNYRKIVIETYNGTWGSSAAAPPARPLARQGLDTYLKVECSSSMRRNHPIGTKFLIEAKLTEGYGTPFLYSSYRWSWKVLTSAEALEYIKSSSQSR